MSKKISVAILGHGNLGRGVEKALAHASDMELFGIFTRRDPASVAPLTTGAEVFKIDEITNYKNEIDVVILCGGSATDLPVQGPELAKSFNIVDSFDTHAKIPEYFSKIDAASSSAKKVGIISIGWDPGLFSIARMLFGAILPSGKDYTFWGKGISQGHSDAIRRVSGVKNGVQYTIPIDEAIKAVRDGRDPELSTRQKHLRECFVVAEEGADKVKIESEIKNMPNYFSDYDTIVNFISEDELKNNHSKMPHGGFVFRSGKTGFDCETNHILELSIKLDSNPEFTSSVLVAYARAAYRLNVEGGHGAKTVFDIPISYLSEKSDEELRRELL